MKQTFFKTLLIAATMLGASNTVNADCSVTTDSYGKTQVVWDFGVTATNITAGGSYYLNANTNSYVEWTGSDYATVKPSRENWLIAQAQIKGGSNRSIYSSTTPDSDKGAGVAMGSGSGEGLINFWAPISGTVRLSTTGGNNWLNRFTITDKTSGSSAFAVSSDGTCGISIIKGHRYQILATSGAGVTSITLTPDGYGTDNVSSGTQNYADNGLLSGTSLPTAERFYYVSSTGYKEISKVDDVTDALVVYNKVANGAVFDVTSESSYTGLKILGNQDNYYNYTSSKNGTLTINYSYGGDRGPFVAKTNGVYYNQVSRGETSLVVEMGEGQRVQIHSFTNSAYINRISFEEKENVTATIGTYGYTSFSSRWPLDLSGMKTSEGDVTAYYATSIGADAVTITRIADNVEAGEGLILKGTAGATITIPVAASGSPISNYLVGCPNGTTLDANSSYYVLVNNTTAERAEFQSLESNGATIPAGKAYLNAGGASVKALSIVFDDTATGIKTMNNGQLIIDNAADAVYDLQGRKIAPLGGAQGASSNCKLPRGMYIINGKKVIVNN